MESPPRSVILISENESQRITQRSPLLEESINSTNNTAKVDNNIKDSDCFIGDDNDEDIDYYAYEKDKEINRDFDMNKNFYWSRKIQIPEKTTNVSKYPKEKFKTFMAFLLLIFGFIFNSISIALVHDRVPDRTLHPPLPDAILDNIYIIPELMRVPDVFVLITMITTGTMIALHRHRWILARRAFFILSVLYCMRSITMYVTVLPIANNTVYCSPKSNGTSVYLIVKRVFELFEGGGLQISGQKKSCGDYIYSGHTCMLMVGYLFIKEYLPKRLFMIQWISCLLSWSGMCILLIARGHYTIDVLIGYYASTRMFWTYHMLANNPEFKYFIMGASIIPVVFFTILWGGVGIVLPFLVPKGPNRGVLQVVLMLTGATCWLFWLCCYMAQMNPLIGPIVNMKAAIAIQQEWVAPPAEDLPQ